MRGALASSPSVNSPVPPGWRTRAVLERTQANPVELEARGTAPIKVPTPFLSLVKRPQLDLPTLYRLAGEEPPVPPAVVEQREGG